MVAIIIHVPFIPVIMFILVHNDGIGHRKSTAHQKSKQNLMDYLAALIGTVSGQTVTEGLTIGL